MCSTARMTEAWICPTEHRNPRTRHKDISRGNEGAMSGLHAWSSVEFGSNRSLPSCPRKTKSNRIGGSRSTRSNWSSILYSSTGWCRIYVLEWRIMDEKWFQCIRLGLIRVENLVPVIFNYSREWKYLLIIRLIKIIILFIYSCVYFNYYFKIMFDLNYWKKKKWISIRIKISDSLKINKILEK